MHIIIGLGNPGSLYSETRHNIGFAVVDAMAEQRKLLFKPGKGEYWIGSGSDGGEEIALVKPTTMMNNSGYAVRQIVEQFQIEYTNLIVVHDEIHLPLGTLRFRAYGNDGGHNGMGSVLYHLQREEIPRLRCGIGIPVQEKQRSDLVDFVLSPFKREEYENVRAMILRARDALHDWIMEGIDTAMNRWNPKEAE